MTTKHTPGPWAVESTEYSSSSSPQYEVYAEAGDCVAVCDSEDDALLVAAAPNLLAALESACANRLPCADLPESVWDKVHAAIAKTRGEL